MHSCLIVAFIASLRFVHAEIDYSKYVNPLIGSEGPIAGLAYGGGDIFVGGSMPFGSAKVGIDTYEMNKERSVLNGGYTPQGKVTAISMMHESGTGGFPKYGVIPQMPLTSVEHPVNILDNTTYWQERVGKEIAQVGYYQATLENGVTFELSAARHSGIMQYSFPRGEKHVLVDISHYLPAELGGYSSQIFLGGRISVSPDNSLYYGRGRYGGGWNEGAPMTVYFCGEFDQAPDQARTFRGQNTDPMPRYHTFSNGEIPQATFGKRSETSGPLNDRIGALFTWNDSPASQIKSRVGISFISTRKACRFKNDEISSWNLNDTVDAAVQEWNSEIFNKIRVNTDSTANKTNLVLLYSSMYFMHLMPSDRTGENPLWKSAEPYWDDFYTLWDIFRNTVSLYHLIQPKYYEEMIRSLIDVWRFEGFMPDGRSGNYNGLVQGGSNADNVLADAYVKGMRGAINWTAGYLAMVKDAEVVPYNTFSPDDMSGSVKEGRGALSDWKKLGYVSSHFGRSVSRTTEYSLNDFALSQVAKGEAPGDVQKYLKRSAGWQRIWNHNVKSVSFSGFLTPKHSDGTWDDKDYNPAKCGECEWTSVSYEATPWEYSFVIPHDVDTLIDFMGGKSEFERRLDYAFKPNTSQQNLGENGAGITSLNNPGNEPDFATPYLYNYINKSWKSVRESRLIANQYFHNANYGVPGNSDAGALNSWLIWQMLGLYPIVTQPVYVISSPWFDDLNMTINYDKTLRIKATGLAQNSYYVQSVKINGRRWKRNWFEHKDIMVHGGTIEFELGSKPKLWETGPVPPSPGHVTL